MTGIDDIESITIDGPTLESVALEYRTLFQVESNVSIKELEDYFGASIKMSTEHIEQGFEIERTV